MSAVRDIEKPLESIVAAWNRGDMAAYAQAWLDDGELITVIGSHHRSRAAIRRDLDILHATIFKGTRLQMLEWDVRFPADGIAIAHLRWQMHGARRLPGVSWEKYAAAC